MGSLRQVPWQLCSGIRPVPAQWHAGSDPAHADTELWPTLPLISPSQSPPTCDQFPDRREFPWKRGSIFSGKSGSDLSGNLHGHLSPITVDALLSKPPSDVIEFLLTYQGEKFIGPDREGLLSTVLEAVARSFLWGWELVNELEAREEWSTDPWDAIISGWQAAHLTETQWEEVLQFLERRTEIWQHGYKIAELLKKVVEKSEGGLSVALLSRAEALTDRLWQELEDYNEKEMENNDNDWLTRAINHIGGIITQFWLLALSRRQAEKGGNWQGIPDKYKTRFERIISGKSSAAAMGRVIIASQLHFLFSLDRSWTRKKIVPLLNWDIDVQRAVQAWGGYLWWGRWNEALLPELLPLYEQAYIKLTRGLKVFDRLCDHLASIAVRSSVDP